jgi:transcriptional regulator with XRE-family HTH domain
MDEESEENERLESERLIKEEETERWYHLGHLLQDVRATRTLKDVAEAAGISVSTLNTLEKGGRTVRGEWVLPSPEDKTLVKLAEALHIPARELFSELGRDVPAYVLHASVANDPVSIAAHGADLEELRQLDPEGYEHVIAMARFQLEQAKARKA